MWSGALPAALAPLGIAVRTLLPGYRGVLAALAARAAPAPVRRTDGRPRPAARGDAPAASICSCSTRRICSTATAGPTTPRTARDWPDNPQRFAALCQAAAAIAAGRPARLAAGPGARP